MHYAAAPGEWYRWSACGAQFVATADPPLTRDFMKVTCEVCRRSPRYIKDKYRWVLKGEK